MLSKFSAIAARAIADAEAIDVSFDEFVHGLREIEHEISNQLWLAEDELDHMHDHDTVTAIDGEIIE